MRRRKQSGSAKERLAEGKANKGRNQAQEGRGGGRKRKDHIVCPVACDGVPKGGDSTIRVTDLSGEEEGHTCSVGKNRPSPAIFRGSKMEAKRKLRGSG